MRDAQYGVAGLAHEAPKPRPVRPDGACSNRVQGAHLSNSELRFAAETANRAAGSGAHLRPAREAGHPPPAVQRAGSRLAANPAGTSFRTKTWANLCKTSSRGRR